MERVNTLQTLHKELSEALSNATVHSELRAIYASFKRRIDCLNVEGNEKARELYFNHKRRIFGRDYDFQVLPHEEKEIRYANTSV